DQGGSQAAQKTEELFALRDRLIRDVKESKQGGKGNVKGGAQAAHGQPHPPLNHGAAFSLVLDIISAPPAVVPSAAKGSGAPTTEVVAFETLDHLLRRAQSIVVAGAFPNELDSLRTQLSLPFLLSLSHALYIAWDIQPPAIQLKLKSILVTLLALASSAALDVPEVSRQLKSKVLADPWNSKRSLNSFDALLPHGQLEDFAAFAAASSMRLVDVPEGVVQKLVDSIVGSDETAPIAAKVAVAWIEKCWARRPPTTTEDQLFWIRPILEACRREGGAKGRHNICTYLVQGILNKRKEAFRELLSTGGYLFEGDDGLNTMGEGDLESALAILRVGNSLNLVDLDATAPSSAPCASEKIALPTTLLRTTLQHSSPSLRAATLSLLVLAPSSATAFPLSSFPLLKTFYAYSLGDEEGEIRMQTVSLTGRLLLRLRDSAWRAQRTINKGKDGIEGAKAYIEAVKEWMEWWLALVGKENLNPARPYRLKMNSLRMLDLAFQARVDAAYRVDFGIATEDGEEVAGAKKGPSATNGYSTYRKTATTQTPMFNAKHRKIQKIADATGAAAPSVDETGWPFAVSLVTPETSQVLLRQLLSTYTAIRSLAISMLERFPAPLPGYDGADGAEKAKQELLVPALRMIRSGREAEASAGAGVVDLARAASTIPMHGTLLALRYLFISIPPSAFDTLSNAEDRRALFHRALAVVKRVWDVTSPVLAAKELFNGEEADTEEARAIRVERNAAATKEATEGGAEDDADLDDAEAAEGIGGPQHKIILNACWRAMKEAGELLETVLRLPSELGTSSFRFVWHYEEVCEIGELFAVWLRRIRHRGAAMALHPCYSRAAGALLTAGKDWPEVGALPEQWLERHLDSIVSSRISFTRRSAGLPYLLVGLLTTILPSSRPTFERAFARLFEIAESTSPDILDESRVHAMNTLRTAFLDAKCAGAVLPYVERAFLLSISLWICRNVATLLFAALITRAFGARRTNLDRDHVSLSKRMTIDDFFGRYPTLKGVLRDELERGWKESLDELPIRDVAGDALTGLISPSQVPSTCEGILLDVVKRLPIITHNELHGRLGQVLRLLRAVGALSTEAEAQASSAQPLRPQYPPAVLAPLLLISLHLPSALSSFSSPVVSVAATALSQAASWNPSAYHLPSTEEFLRACWQVLYAAAPSETDRVDLVKAGLAGRSLEVKRHALAQLATLADESRETAHEVRLSLLERVLDEKEAGDVRVSAVETLRSTGPNPGEVQQFGALKALDEQTVIVPLREGVIPVLASLAERDEERDAVLDIIDRWSTPDESVESREASSLSLAALSRPAESRPRPPSQQPRFARCLVRLLQDDDPTARSYAYDAAQLKRVEGKALEQVLRSGGRALVERVLEEERVYFERDLELIANPSSLLFAIEKPNIYRDDHLLPSLLLPILSSPTCSSLRPAITETTERQLLDLSAGVESGRGMEPGPLGRAGNELVCKWAGPLIRRWESLAEERRSEVEKAVTRLQQSA
ncbi:SPOSA6832_03343, partial [Sporobolomyces salmonicolor]